MEFIPAFFLKKEKTSKNEERGVRYDDCCFVQTVGMMNSFSSARIECAPLFMHLEDAADTFAAECIKG